MSRYPSILALTLWCSISACGPGWDLVEWSGEFVTYRHSKSLQTCRGTPGYVDGFVPFVASELGMEVPRNQAYYWLDEKDYGETSCNPQRRGCADVGEGFSSDPWYLHEMVHAVAFRSLEYQPFFGEGLAVALDPWNGDNLGPRYVLSTTPERLPDPRQFMTLPAEEIHYSTAGSFVLFLLARHGAEKFMAFSRELGTSRDMIVIRAAFRRVYAAELDDEAELFITGTPCTEETFAVGLYDCTMPEVDWTDGVWSLEGVMSCESEDVAGGTGPDGTWSSLRSVTLEVPSAGMYRLVAQGSGDVAAQMGPCFGCPWDLRDVGLSAGEARTVTLAAGTYFVRIRAESAASSEFELTLSPE